MENERNRIWTLMRECRIWLSKTDALIFVAERRWYRTLIHRNCTRKMSFDQTIAGRFIEFLIQDPRRDDHQEGTSGDRPRAPH